MNAECQKCGHRWVTRIENTPDRCPRCKTKKWRQDDTRMFVYVFELSSGYIKVGISKKPEERKSGIRSSLKVDILRTKCFGPTTQVRAKEVEQDVLFSLSEFNIEKTELLVVPFDVVCSEVSLFFESPEKNVLDLLSSGDEYLPLVPLVREINKERFLAGKRAFNFNGWKLKSENRELIDEVEKQYGKAIINRRGGHTFIHKVIFVSVGLSSCNKLKISILSLMVSSGVVDRGLFDED